MTSSLVPAVVRAAAACLPVIGSDDGYAVDAAAVAAMRAALADVPFDGRVVIGEGEKDDAPMLHLGERFGRARPGDPAIDIAVDPVDGTRLAASGRPGAMAVVAVAPRGSLFDLGPAHYLEKLVTWVPGIDVGGASAGGIPAAVTRLVDRAAATRGVPRGDVVVAVQDRPRNRPYVDAVERAGGRVELFEHGDVERSLRALQGGPAVWGDDGAERGGSGPDGVVGIGGAPEGVIVAVGVRALGGSMLARFAPQSDGERERVLAHLDGRRPVDAVIDLDGLCTSHAESVDLIVAAVTDCAIGVGLPGVRAVRGGVRVHHWAASDRVAAKLDLLER